MAVKKRRITKKDWDEVANFIKSTLEARKGGKHRKQAERMWKETDRQVAMESMSRQSNNNQQTNDWRSALELGELSRASEVLSAEMRRMAFPQNRAWFDPHIDIKPAEDGKVNQREQKQMDGALRALMAQQHLDFGLKSRVDLSIKEALHHGGYVAEVEEITMLGAQPDGMVKDIKAPVWIPHSMWNCYPDDRPSSTVGALFYTGSMIICSYMSHKSLMEVKGEGWIKDNFKDIEDPKSKDHELASFHGDITISRTKGDNIYLPNVKAIAIKDKLIYFKANDLPYSRIIYNGYERLDVRNPYFISPLMKMSPTQKIASVMANKLIDSVELSVEPPIIYDGNDSDFVMTGGPDLSPGAKSPSKNLANFKEIKVGDPSAALTAVQFHISELQKGTSVDSIRSGMSSSTEQTATEVERTRQGGQIRTIDFLDKHELQGLRPFLYLQHECNKRNLKSYKFYSSEMDSADFVTVANKDLPKDVHFDVVGSKGLVEEEQRQARTMSVTQFAYSIGKGDKINFDALIKEMYQDAGNKNPERFLLMGEEGQAEQQLEQIMPQMQEMEQQMQLLSQENQDLKLHEESKVQEIQSKAAIEMAKQDNEEDKLKAKSEFDMAKLQAETEINEQELQDKLQIEQQKLENQLVIEKYKVDANNVTHESLGKVAEIKKEDLEGVGRMEAISEEMKKTLTEFEKIQSTPKKVVRDKNGLITGIELGLDS